LGKPTTNTRTRKTIPAKTTTETKTTMDASAMKRIRTMGLEEWNTVLQVASVVVLGVTFLIGAGAVWTSYLVNKRQGERMAAMARDTANASKAAAEANARAAEANAEAAQARKETAEAQRDVWELRQKVQWRSLSTTERTKLRDALRATVDKGIVTLLRRDSRDEEAEEYAGEIASVLAESGWRARSLIGSDDLIPRDPVGLSIRVVEPNNPPPHAAPLKAALDSALGLSVPITQASKRPGFDENVVALLIHPKRP
jgi:hypothetical protein